MTVVIDPVGDVFVERSGNLKTKLEAMVDIARAIVVHNEESFRRITGMYAESKDWDKRIEAMRKEHNKPDEQRIKARNDKAKEILGPLRTLQEIARIKTDAYQKLLESEKAAEQIAIQDAAEFLGEDLPIPFVTPLEKSQRGDGAIAYTKLVKKWRIADLEQVPRKYLIIDEKTVDRDIKLGVSNIPGLEIYEEKVTQLKCR